MSTAMHLTTTDFEVIKTRQKATWGSANYGQIGVRLQIVGEALCEAVDVHACDNVIDVAAGNGNAALAAARRYADVTATDYVPELLEHAQRRAQTEGLPLLTRVADAEDLPFPDASFDVALSTFGVMFAPNQERAAVELMRVVRPGGRIALASWTPDGFVGQLFRELGRFSPPPAGVMPPTAWGNETRPVCGRHSHRAPSVCVPSSVRRALDRGLPPRLRPDPPCVREPGGAATGRAARRAQPAAGPARSRREGFAGRTVRVPGNRHPARLSGRTLHRSATGSTNRTQQKGVRPRRTP
jgi:SAM-dependent methyltransferase